MEPFVDEIQLFLRDESGRLPLHKACANGTIENVTNLLLVYKNKFEASKKNNDEIIDYVRDQTGQTPLFDAVFRDDKDAIFVVGLLLKEFPRWVLVCDNHLRTALHCYNSATNVSMDILKALIDASPRATDTLTSYIVPFFDRKGMTACHTLCSLPTIPIAELELLLLACPEFALLEDAQQFTPIHYSWNSFKRRIGKSDESEPIFFDKCSRDHVEFFHVLKTFLCAASKYDLSIDAPLNTNSSLQQFIDIFVRLSLFQPWPLFAFMNSTGEIFTLHSASKSSRGWGSLHEEDDLSVLERTLISSPQNARCYNDEGDLPLHVAAKSTPFKTWCISQEDNPSYSSVIELLLKAYPEGATIPNKNGRLPLHCLITSKKSWSSDIIILLQHSSNSLLVKDPITKLMPFMMAAVSEEASIAEVFKLLRANPIAICKENLLSDIKCTKKRRRSSNSDISEWSRRLRRSQL